MDDANHFIEFRASYEKGENWRRISNLKNNCFTVNETKILIAKELGIDRKFARNFDLRLNIYDSDQKPRAVVDNGNQLINSGVKLIFNRVFNQPFCDSNINENGDSNVNNLKSKKIENHKVSTTFKCNLCSNFVLSTIEYCCSNRCVKNICSSCFDTLNISDANNCVFCKQCALINYHKSSKSHDSIRKKLVNLKKNEKDFGEHSDNNFSISETNHYSEDNKTSSELALPNNITDSFTNELISGSNQLWLIFVSLNQLKLAHSYNYIIFPYDIYQDYRKKILTDSSTKFMILMGKDDECDNIFCAGIGIIDQVVGISKSKVQKNSMNDIDFSYGLSYVHKDSINRLPGSVVKLEYNNFLLGDKNIENFELDSWDCRLLPLADYWYANQSINFSDEMFCIKLLWKFKYDSFISMPIKTQPFFDILSTSNASNSLKDDTHLFLLLNNQKINVIQRLKQISNFDKQNSSKHYFQNFETILSSVIKLNLPRFNRVSYSQEEQKKACMKISKKLEYILNNSWLEKLKDILPPDWTGINPIVPFIKNWKKLSKSEFELLQNLQLLMQNFFIDKKYVFPELALNRLKIQGFSWMKTQKNSTENLIKFRQLISNPKKILDYNKSKPLNVSAKNIEIKKKKIKFAYEDKISVKSLDQSTINNKNQSRSSSNRSAFSKKNTQNDYHKLDKIEKSGRSSNENNINSKNISDEYLSKDFKYENSDNQNFYHSSNHFWKSNNLTKSVDSFKQYNDSKYFAHKTYSKTVFLQKNDYKASESSQSSMKRKKFTEEFTPKDVESSKKSQEEQNNTKSSNNEDSKLSNNSSHLKSDQYNQSRSSRNFVEYNEKTRIPYNKQNNLIDKSKKTENSNLTSRNYKHNDLSIKVQKSFEKKKIEYNDHKHYNTNISYRKKLLDRNSRYAPSDLYNHKCKNLNDHRNASMNDHNSSSMRKSRNALYSDDYEKKKKKIEYDITDSQNQRNKIITNHGKSDSNKKREDCDENDHKKYDIIERRKKRFGIHHKSNEEN